MISKKDIETNKLQDEKCEKMQREEQETKPCGQVLVDRVSWCLAKRNKWEGGHFRPKAEHGERLGMK